MKGLYIYYQRTTVFLFLENTGDNIPSEKSLFLTALGGEGTYERTTYLELGEAPEDDQKLGEPVGELKRDGQNCQEQKRL